MRMRTLGHSLVLTVGLFSCRSSPPAAQDGSRDQAAEQIAAVTDGPREGDGGAVLDGSIEARACGGTVTAIGNAPAGRFGGTDVHLRVVFVCRRVDVTITDLGTGAVLAFSMRPSVDGGALSLVGSQTVTATYVAGGSSITTPAAVNVTVADDPFGAGPTDAAPAGHMEASFTLSQDGFSISGSFSSPYCLGYVCPV